MAREDIEDVRRVLAICFRDGQSLDALDIERILSFDMEWISPDEAEKAVQALIGKGWLSGEESALRPTVSLEDVQSPLGWFPRPSRLLMPVSPSEAEPVSEKDVPDSVKPTASVPVKAKAPQTAEASNDPRAKLVKRLTKFIAKSSQIPVDEVERRAQRKQQALGYATQWMCLALVAREQNLSMKEIIEALSTL
ncbi:MAG: DUF2240 family protein [Candidatus Poseidoniales archaeon]|nr:MAG: DUF2240 family protein [Candidatus Poseidoniales archaeon]